MSSRQLGLQRLDIPFTQRQLTLQSVALPLVSALLSMGMLQAEAELGRLAAGFLQLICQRCHSVALQADVLLCMCADLQGNDQVKALDTEA